jgi:hypothetical protein
VTLFHDEALNKIALVFVEAVDAAAAVDEDFVAAVVGFDAVVLLAVEEFVV